MQRAHTGIAVPDDKVTKGDDGDGDEGDVPTDEEHCGDAEQCDKEAEPHVVILEGGPPADGLYQAHVKSGQVHQGEGGEEEIGNDQSHRIQTGCKNIVRITHHATSYLKMDQVIPMRTKTRAKMKVNR